ncbi:molybdopterin synthase sulfur carrier subunit [Ferrithrix thermotolerans DSM 19514]|jgi:MoaD family protein|uniref:Molybdopterin synthase sulfur carrier subunit n=1 Tax=Ferrithrix thermotolerans DSM 19514 TaxID=1121881 RepID=A0A1M4Y7A6_9ACTN|nr:MoaD/ThiS family protein [Ferrithrix thermotolerans]SHF01704.1 molybdopterin synthase sulfur carrier subunit [Ferrithrix thermotolerans DSM 19514]
MSVKVLFFARAKEIAGKAETESDAATIDLLLKELVTTYGPELESLLSVSRLWVNDEPADVNQPLRSGDQVAILPPVSGG